MNQDALERLILDAIDGQLLPEQELELAQILASNPDALESYCQFASIDSALHRHTAGHSAISQPTPEATLTAASRQRRHLRLSLLAGAAALTLLLSLLSLIALHHNPNLATLHSSSDAILTLRDASGKILDHKKAYLTKNSVITLDQGSLELQFRNGVTSILSAPTLLHITSDHTVDLSHGSAWFHVPTAAKGFRVTTPDLDVVDLGTIFAVRSEPGRSDEVHVLAGSVSATHRKATSPSPTILRQNQAVSASPRHLLESIPTQAAAFNSELGAAEHFLHWSFEPEETAGFTASGNHPDTDAAPLLPAGNQAQESILGIRGQALRIPPGSFLKSPWNGILHSHPRTISAWIRIPKNTPDSAIPRSIVFWGRESDSLSSRKWRLGLNLNRFNEGGTRHALRTEFGHGWSIGSSPLNDGQWHHIASVYQGGNHPDNSQRVLLYVDGQPESLTSAQHQPIDTQTGTTLTIGGFEGLLEIDELTIHQRALSPQSIALLAQPSSSPQTTQPKH